MKLILAVFLDSFFYFLFFLPLRAILGRLGISVGNLLDNNKKRKFFLPKAQFVRTTLRSGMFSFTQHSYYITARIHNFLHAHIICTRLIYSHPQIITSITSEYLPSFSKAYWLSFEIPNNFLNIISLV